MSEGSLQGGRVTEVGDTQMSRGWENWKALHTCVKFLNNTFNYF